MSPRLFSLAPVAGLVLLATATLVQAAAPSGKVKSLRIETRLEYGNREAAPSGLRVLVFPLDTRGDVVPVTGRVEFTLVGEREHNAGGDRHGFPPDFPVLEQQSSRVRRADFAGGPASYELRFTRFDPEASPDLVPLGLLKARLSVPGQGIFEAADANAQLREFSRFRDQLEYYRGGRKW